MRDENCICMLSAMVACLSECSGAVCMCVCVVEMCEASRMYGIERKEKWWRLYRVMTAMCPIYSFFLRSLPLFCICSFSRFLPPHQSGHHTLLEMTQTRPDW